MLNMGIGRRLWVAISGIIPVLMAVAGCISGGGDSRSFRDGEVRKGSGVTEPEIRLPYTSNENAVILYDRFAMRMVAYDERVGEVILKTDAVNYFQYSFPTQSEFFTSGNSMGRDFRLLRVWKDEIRTVLEFPSGVGMFPLATDGRRHLYVFAKYDKNGEELSRKVVSVASSGRMHEYKNVGEGVMGGALIGSKLFYTVYDKKKGFWLYKIDADDYRAKPELQPVRGLRESDLRVWRKKLFIYRGNAFVNGKRSIRCSDLCWFFDSQQIAIRMYTDDQSGLKLDIVDIPSGRTLATRKSVVDFRVHGRKVTIYQYRRIDTIDLDDLTKRDPASQRRETAPGQVSIG